MLILLPALAFLLLWLAFADEDGRDGDAPIRVRRAFLLAYTFWGAELVILLEGLSLFGAVRQIPLSLGWLAIIAALAVVSHRRGTFRRLGDLLCCARPRLTRWEWALVGGIAAVCGMLLLVALVSAPNNIDSLLYHMARVAHWAQNGSLHHYAAVYHHQLRMPPWAEMSALNLYVLAGGDWPVNLVQWWSMISCLILAGGMAQMLGGGRPVRILSATLVLSLPMVLLQSTSTQNDLVTAAWLMALAYSILMSLRDPADRWLPIVVGLALGLAVLTKVTAAVYAPGFVVWFLVGRWRSGGGRGAVRELALAGLVALALNLPYMTRNVLTYGSPVGDVDFIVARLTVSEGTFPGGDRGAAANPVVALWEGMSWAATRVARAAALNLITPSFAVNQAILRVLGTVPAVFTAKTTASLQGAAWNHEDTAGNPVHLALYLAAALAAVVFRSKAGSPRGLLPYLLCSIMGFMLLPLILTRGSVFFGVRYQLPFFVLWAPGVASILGGLFRPRWVAWLSAGMLLLALPYVLLNNTRPLVGVMPWPTRVGSVLQAGRSQVLFAGAPTLADRYASMAQEIDRRDCPSVGLKIDSGDLEYLFWWTLRDAIDGVRIEIVDPLPSLSRYIDPGFSPCAIVCTVCQGSDHLHGLPLVLESGRARLFAGEGYRPEADK